MVFFLNSLEEVNFEFSGYFEMGIFNGYFFVMFEQIIFQVNYVCLIFF